MRTTIAVAALALSLAACASAPREVVVLADVSAQQLASIRASHFALVAAHYDGLREQAEAFLAEQWLPSFLEKTLDGQSESSQQLLSELRVGWKLLEVDTGDLSIALSGGDLDPDERSALQARLFEALATDRSAFAQTMLDYSLAVQHELKQRRRSLLRPINAQERWLVDELTQAYDDLHASQTTLRAYLASVVELRQEQDTVLRELGLLDERNAVMDALATGSERLDEAIERGDEIDELAAELEAQLQRLRERFGGDD